MVPRYDNSEIWTKKIGEFGFGKSAQKLPKINEKCYFTELTSK